MKRLWTVIAGIASVAALVAVPAAYAAYTSPKLEVTQAGAITTIKASLNPNDDPTASLRILAPSGTQATTNQAPGTVLGQVRAVVKALDLAGADLPLEGQILVAAPGQVSAADADCVPRNSSAHRNLGARVERGRTAACPPGVSRRYDRRANRTRSGLHPGVRRTAGCAGGDPGRATFGAKLYSVEATLNGVFSTVSAGAWIGFWTPYTPLVGAVNVAGTVASPASIAPGAVSLTARRAGRRGVGATLAGRVTQGGAGRAATVTIVGGSAAGRLRSLGRARVAANGAFTFRANAGTFFRATAVAAPGASAQVCSQIGPVVAPVPCVNATVNGFRAQSRVVRKR